MREELSTQNPHLQVWNLVQVLAVLECLHRERQPCRGHNLRETLLEHACADMLGTQRFDPVSVAEQVVMIEAFEHQLTFHLADGTMTPVGLTSEGRLA